MHRAWKCEECKKYAVRSEGSSVIINGLITVVSETDTENAFTATGWTANDVGKVVYNVVAVEAGTTPNKYIVFGWRRLRAGNGNMLNTDWLPLRLMTGNQQYLILELCVYLSGDHLFFSCAVE